MRRLELKSAIDLAPLVDVVLLTLAYFLINAALANEPSIPMELPRAESGRYTEVDVLVIAIGDAGTVFIQGEQVSDAHLQTALSHADGVRIRASGAADYKSVVRVLDLARQADIKDIELGVRE